MAPSRGCLTLARLSTHTTLPQAGKLAVQHQAFVTLQSRLQQQLGEYQQRCMKQQEEISHLRRWVIVVFVAVIVAAAAFLVVPLPLDLGPADS